MSDIEEGNSAPPAMPGQEDFSSFREIEDGWRYIGAGGKPQAQTTQRSLRKLYASGAIPGSTLVWVSGMQVWAKYSQVFPEDVPPPVPSRASSSGGLSTANSPESREDIEDFELAEPGTRLGARFIDALVSGVVCIPGALAAANTYEGDVEAIQRVVLLFAVPLLALLILQAYLISTSGQSLGKKALDIKIVSNPDEANPGFARAYLIRELLPSLVALVPLWGTIPYLINVLFVLTPSRRCLHDYLVSTKVVKVRPTNV